MMYIVRINFSCWFYYCLKHNNGMTMTGGVNRVHCNFILNWLQG